MNELTNVAIVPVGQHKSVGELVRTDPTWVGIPLPNPSSGVCKIYTIFSKLFFNISIFVIKFKVDFTNVRYIDYGREIK